MTQRSFTKRKFLELDPRQRHKKCAELLRSFYEKFRAQEILPEEAFSDYNRLLSWLALPPYCHADLKSLADQYHWHLKEARWNLKEHNLLPSIRTGDRTPKADFLPIAIYLDNVRSAYNVGSILRTAEALRLGKVYFSAKTPFIDNEKVQRTAMGAADLVPCFQKISPVALPRPLIALETSEEATPLAQFSFPAVFTLIVGNEEYGISNEVLAEVDILVEIPLLGAKNSLNVACAFAIAAAEIRRGTFPKSCLEV